MDEDEEPIYDWDDNYDDDWGEDEDPDDYIDDIEEEDDYVMTITEWVAGSCACYAIAGLGQNKNAYAAFKRWCRLALGKGEPSRYGMAKFDIPASHYIFIAGPEEAGKGHSKHWVKYGTEFAQFIQDNKFGKVTTLDARVNERHHPDTTCQVWLWQPDFAACEQWWMAQLEEAKNNPPILSNYRKSIKPEDNCPTCGYKLVNHADWDCPFGYSEWPDYSDLQWAEVKAKQEARKKLGW